MKKLFKKQAVSYKLIHQMYPEYEEDKTAARDILLFVIAATAYLYYICQI